MVFKHAFRILFLIILLQVAASTTQQGSYGASAGQYGQHQHQHQQLFSDNPSEYGDPNDHLQQEERLLYRSPIPQQPYYPQGQTYPTPPHMHGGYGKD